MTSSISLLIITYNRPGDLLELLESLAKQHDLDTLKEVLVLNNASTTDYSTVLSFIERQSHIPIQYIASNENLGVSRGRNKLMAMAKGDYLLVLDDDILFTDAGDLKRISIAFDKPFFRDANTAALTFRVIYQETGELQATAFPHKRIDEFRDRPEFLTSYFTGCSHLLKRSILEKTGLYPEDFFYGMEEYDLSYRIIREGYSLGYDSIVTFIHKESPKGRQPNHIKLASQWVNKSKVAWRYLPRVYYFTTMIGWSFEYLRKAGGHLGTYFRSWGKAWRVCVSEKRTPLNKRAMDYLSKVKARRWY